MVHIISAYEYEAPCFCQGVPGRFNKVFRLVMDLCDSSWLVAGRRVMSYFLKVTRIFYSTNSKEFEQQLEEQSTRCRCLLDRIVSILNLEIALLYITPNFP